MIYESSDFTQVIQKVLVVGLDNAGKTSVINNLQRELGLDTLLNIKIFREMLEIQGLKYDYYITIQVSIILC